MGYRGMGYKGWRYRGWGNGGVGYGDYQAWEQQEMGRRPRGGTVAFGQRCGVGVHSDGAVPAWHCAAVTARGPGER